MATSGKKQSEKSSDDSGLLSAENRAQMEQDTDGANSRALLRQLQNLDPALLNFQAWSDVAKFVTHGAATDAQPEKIISAALELHAQHRSKESGQVLVLLLWKVLLRSQRVAWSWDQDGVDLWQNTLNQFLRVLAEYDPATPARSHQQLIFQRTVSRLRKQYQRTWRQANAELRWLSELNSDQFVIRHDGFDRVDNEDEFQHAMSCINRGVESGLLRIMDRELILATRQPGQSLHTVSRKLGISYETARKRRQRAEARLREKFLRNS